MAQIFANNATGKLANAINTTETSIVLESGQGAKFPTPSNGDYFLLTLATAIGTEAEWEICKCTNRVGDTLTVNRGQEGTVPISWPVLTKAEIRLTAGTLSDIKSSISASNSNVSNLTALIYAGL